METTIERISAVECRVRVEIPWEDVRDRLGTKLKDLRRRARVPGFRPGKVPPQVIERMFGKSVRAELSGELVDETFPNACREHSTIALTKPVVEESQLDKGQAFKYAARFETPPELEVKDYVSVPVRRRPAVAEDSAIEAELDKKREELTEMQPIAEDEVGAETSEGDVWTVDIDGTVGDERANRKDVSVEIGSETNEVVPGLAQAMKALKRDAVGGVLAVEFDLPEGRIRKDLVGKKAQLSLGLRDVKRKVVPELDDDFARDTGDAESLEELKNKIRSQLEEADGQRAEQEAQRRLVEALLERNEFEPPPSMISQEVKAQVDMYKRQLAQQGVRLEQVGMNDQQLASQIRPQAAFNVKAYLLLDAIGKAEDITVSEEDFEKELESMAKESGQNVARMKATMEKNGQLLVLRAQMREQRIFEFLMDKADVTVAPDPEPEPEEEPEHDHDHDHDHSHGGADEAVADADAAAAGDDDAAAGAGDDAAASDDASGDDEKSGE